MEPAWIIVTRFLLGLFVWFMESTVIIGAVIFVLICAFLAMGKL